MTEPELIPFDTQRSDISIQGTFESELWSLFHDVPRLYSGLLHGLRDTGITPNSIKVDNGDGSLGGYNVQFWLFDLRVLVRVRLDRFEIDFRNTVQSDIVPVDHVLVGLVDALTASTSGFRVASYLVDLHLHGDVVGVDRNEYLGRFVKNAPDLGPSLGSGCVFYFGDQPGAPLRTVTVDQSGVVPGKVSVRLYTLLDGSIAPGELRAVVEKEATASLAAIGLEAQGK